MIALNLVELGLGTIKISQKTAVCQSSIGKGTIAPKENSRSNSLSLSVCNSGLSLSSGFKRGVGGHLVNS